MSGTIVLEAASSPATLPAGTKRLPRAPRRPRSAKFYERFDADGLFYDCFWHADGRRVLLVGPPPVNLWREYRAIRFEALPSRASLSPRFHPSLSTMIVELDAPQGTNAISVRLGEGIIELPLCANHSEELRDRRVLFGMNKDNDLPWIREWAAFHAHHHRTDAVVLFDNGSTRYGLGELGESLRSVDGLSSGTLLSWPQKFGFTDDAVSVNPYWAHFLQIASMSVVLRRFGAFAHAILNCDIDELARPIDGTTLYDAAVRTHAGLAVFRGQWIEAVGDGAAGDHRDFHMRHRDPKRARSRPKKWALDPKRTWVRNLGVHPYWHWIEGRPWFGKVTPAGAGYWHFRGINTNWKTARTDPAVPPEELEPDRELIAAFEAERAAGALA